MNFTENIKFSSRSERNQEVHWKLKSARALMKKYDITCLHLRGVDWFSWITAGANSWVILTNEVGIAEVFITLEKALVITNVIETVRLLEEELPDGFEVLSHPWQVPFYFLSKSSDSIDSYYARLFPEKKTYFLSGLVASDRPLNKEITLPREFLKLKVKLLPSEISRYEKIGLLASQAMTKAMSQARPNMSEHELAGLGAKELLTRGLEPTLILVSGENRGTKFRHPLPQNSPLGNLAMMVFCARKEGLYANLTRFVSFKALSSDLKNRYENLLEIEAELFKNTVPGKKLNDIYFFLEKKYHELDPRSLPSSEIFFSEIHNHHQGGITGYLSREIIASPHTDFSLETSMAIAWNPSIPGLKVEDTVLISEPMTEHRAAGTLKILTHDPEWPNVAINSIARPLIWQM